MTKGRPPRLFEGNLTTRHVESLARGETVSALAERELELEAVAVNRVQSDASLGEAGSPGHWLPKQLLEPAAEYSVVSGDERIGFTTLAEEPALLRIWPHETSTPHAVFCLDSAYAPEPFGDSRAYTETAAVSFGVPGDGGVEVSQGWTQLAHSPACWFWEAPGPESHSSDDATNAASGAATQPHLKGVAVQPTWPTAALSDGLPAVVACGENELSIGWACAIVQDDRLLVHGGEHSSFWRVEGDAEAWFILAPGRTGVVRGLGPEQRHELTFTARFAGSAPMVQAVTVTMGSVRPHVTINEVMADPVGAEPNQEWVELYNDGTTPVNLDGWKLKDENGEMTLPTVWLAPSGYALLVNDTYVSNVIDEPVPEPNALIVRLPTLAKSGLSNGGEALRLLDKSDMVVASFPGTPMPTPGVSVARGAAWQVDEPSAFGQHALPGASPGAPNRLRAVNLGKQ